MSRLTGLYKAFDRLTDAPYNFVLKMTYNQIVDHYGGLSKAAQALGFSRQRVHAWKKIRIPSDEQLRIAALTGLKADRQSYKQAARIASYVAGARS